MEVNTEMMSTKDSACEFPPFAAHARVKPRSPSLVCLSQELNNALGPRPRKSARDARNVWKVRPHNFPSAEKMHLGVLKGFLRFPFL